MKISIRVVNESTPLRPKKNDKPLSPNLIRAYCIGIVALGAIGLGLMGVSATGVIKKFSLLNTEYIFGGGASVLCIIGGIVDYYLLFHSKIEFFQNPT